MLIKPWEGYFVNGLIEKKDNNFKIVEIDQNRAWSMTLNVLTNVESTYYQLFSKDQLEEKSRINFCRMTNFPDAILFEVKDSGDLIFHLIEFKKNPSNGDNFEKISKQFLSGYMHTKLIQPFIDPSIIKNAEVKYKYYVIYVHEKNGRNSSPGFPKVIPGTPVAKLSKDKKQLSDDIQNVKRRRQLREWENDCIVFRSLQPDSYTVFKKINKVRVNQCESMPNIGISYENTITI